MADKKRRGAEGLEGFLEGCVAERQPLRGGDEIDAAHERGACSAEQRLEHWNTLLWMCRHDRELAFPVMERMQKRGLQPSYEVLVQIFRYYEGLS